MTDTKTRSIDDFLAKMVEADASDLHLAVGSPAVMRVRGEIVRIPDETPLSPEESRDLIYGILNTGQQKQLEADRQLDFAYAVPGLARFRVNAYFQRASVGAPSASSRRASARSRSSRCRSGSTSFARSRAASCW